MAETEKSSSSKMDTVDVVKSKVAPPARPERPDEEQYKKDLAKAEKELHEAEERMVRLKPLPSTSSVPRVRAARARVPACDNPLHVSRPRVPTNHAVKSTEEDQGEA